MKRLSKILVLLVIVFGSISCLSQKTIPSTTSVSPLEPGSGIKEGSLVYSLPMTVLTFKVDLERVIEVPGPYARYAGELLGLNKVIMNERELWSVKGIHVTSHEETDPSEFYVIESNTLFETNVLALKKAGLMLDLNSLLFAGRGQIISNESDVTDFRTYDLGSNEYFRIQRDTAYRNVNLDSTFVRIPYLVEKKRKLSTDQLAERAAMRLMELREGKILILTGESNVFPQNEAALNELNRLEKEYIELFAGKSWKENRTLTFQLVPKKEMSGNPVELFRFSEETGPLTGKQSGGVPVNVELIPEQKTKELTVVNKKVVEGSDEAVQEFDKLFYRVPDVVNVRVSYGSETLYNSRRLIYQFGTVIPLPANYIIGK